MGGFKFGSVGHLDIDVSIMSFVCVIVFVVFFDIMTGVMEYFLDGSKLYNRMVQLIYKELMLMGLVSFTIIMSQAFQTTEEANSHVVHVWLVAVDFSHILLFFLTFFFVAHAFYLMRKSMLSSFKYHGIMGEPIADLITAIENCSKDPISQFFYQLDYLPFSVIRDRVEFRFANTLFRDTYWLPEEFDFSAYLSGSFDRFALKAINRSPITWLILIILAIFNYARNKLNIGFQSCESPAVLSPSQNTTSTDDGITSTDELSTDSGYNSDACRLKLVQFFLFCGGVLIFYTFLIVFISRLYKLRMLRRIGLSSTVDYYDFLQFLYNEEETHDANESNKLTNEDLKKDIEKVLDEDEHSDETEEFKEIAEALISFKEFVKDIFRTIELKLRVIISRLSSHNSKASKNTSSVTPLLLAFQNVPVSQDSPNSEIRTAESTTPNENINQRHQSLGYLFKQPSRMSISGNSHNANKIPTETEMLLRRLSTKPTKSLLEQSAAPISNLNKIEEEENIVSDNKLVGNSENMESSAVRNRKSMSVNVAHDNGLVRRVQGSQRISVIKMLQDIDYSDSTKDLNARRTILVSNHHVPHHCELDQSTIDHPREKIDIDNKGSHLPDAYRRNHDALQQSIHSTIVHTESNASSLSPRSSINAGKKPRRNSVAVQAPPNTLSTIDKFKLHKLDQAMKIQSKPAVVSYMVNCSSLFCGAFTCLSNLCGLLREVVSKSQVQNVGNDIEVGKSVENSLKHLNEDFSEIYILGQPIYFFRAVEVCILFNCLYMGFWMTDFISICLTIKQSSSQQIIFQTLMIIPVIIVLPLVGYIAETCSMLNAISELNLEVIHEVLIEQEDTQNLLKDLKSKMIERIAALDSTAQDNIKIVRALFDEIDGDGNGWIDRLEFRFLLRTLKLTYSDDRFNRLYRAVDTSGDGKIVWDELYELLFGGLIKEEDEEEGGGDLSKITASDLHPSLFPNQSAKKKLIKIANLARQQEEDDEDDNSSKKSDLSS